MSKTSPPQPASGRSLLTTKLKLYLPNKQKETWLTDATSNYVSCVNFFIERVRAENVGLKLLHRGYYKLARSRFGLSGEITCLAERQALTVSLKGPRTTSNVLVTKHLKLDGNNLGITLGRGYFWIPFHSRPVPSGVLRQSPIKKIGRDWYCFLATEVATPPTKAYKKILGVDLGLAKIAVTSDNKFYRGGEAKAKRDHYHNLRQRLQPKLGQGNVYKLLKRISSHESNFMRDTNHKISRDIVNTAVAQKRTIAIEDLKGIRNSRVRKGFRRQLNGWSFGQLASFIEYKARLAGILCVRVDPRDTSKTCPKCLNVSRKNRKSQERFICASCSYQSNADRIGAINIARKAAEMLVARPLAFGLQGVAHV